MLITFPLMAGMRLYNVKAACVKGFETGSGQINVNKSGRRFGIGFVGVAVVHS